METNYSMKMGMKATGYSFIYPDVQEIFMKYLLCARHCPRCWTIAVKKDKGLCPHGAYILMRGESQTMSMIVSDNVKCYQEGHRE